MPAASSPPNAATALQLADWHLAKARGALSLAEQVLRDCSSNSGGGGGGGRHPHPHQRVAWKEAAAQLLALQPMVLLGSLHLALVLGQQVRGGR